MNISRIQNVTDRTDMEQQQNTGVSTVGAAPLLIAGGITLVLLLIRTIAIPLSEEWDDYLDNFLTQRRAVGSIVLAAGITPIIFIVVYVRSC